VLEEPEEADTSKPQGVSYIRIDDERILKVKLPLEMLVQKAPAQAPPDVSGTSLPPPENMPPPPGMPPMPPPPGMPPMPPPVTREEN